MTTQDTKVSPSERGPRPAFRIGPRADQTCVRERVVRRGPLRLELWTCSDPRPLVRVTWEAHRFPTDYARRWWPGCIGAWYDAHYDERGCTPGRTQYVLYPGGATGPAPEPGTLPASPRTGGPGTTPADAVRTWVAIVDDERSALGEPFRARVAAEAGTGCCPRCHEPWESRYLASHQRGLRCKVTGRALRASLAGLEEAAWYHRAALARAGIPHFLTLVPGLSPFSRRPACHAVYTLPGACAVLRSTPAGRRRDAALRRFREEALEGALRAMPAAGGSP